MVIRAARNSHETVRNTGTPATRPSGIPGRTGRSSSTVSMLRCAVPVVPLAYPVSHDGGRGDRRAGARATATPAVAVALAGGRLQDLPAALPLPLDRPAARTPLAGSGP